MVIDPPPRIDPADPKTWVDPVVSRKIKEMGAFVYKAEYNVPLTPNAVEMAMRQLPDYVEKDAPAVMRITMTRANIKRDGRHRGGFRLEVHWPLSDIGLYDDVT